MEHIIEVLENGILLYCILLKIGSPKSQIRFKIGYPMAIGIYSLVFIILRDPLYLTFLMEIVLYLVLPCILLKNISRSLIIYISLTIVGITTLVGSITVAFSNICSFGTLFPKITFTIVNSFVIIAIILAVYNKKILTYFYDLYNVSKNVKIIIMILLSMPRQKKWERLDFQSQMLFISS